MYREALHLKTKYLLYKFSFTIIYIYFPKTIPSKIYHIYIIYVYINTAVSFKSSITKIYYFCMALSLLFSILRKEHLYFGPRSSQLLLCVTLCPHARKINSFPHKVQFNKSGNFSITQGKFNSYKEVRGR